MRRFIVICLGILSAFCLPAYAEEIRIIGEIWNTDATSYALNPSLGPPSGVAPDARFVVSQINFDSSRIGDKNVSFEEFLNYPTEWLIPATSDFKPKDKMYKNNGPTVQGVFFRFLIPFDMTTGSEPVSITHDDGFVFSILRLFEVSQPDQIDHPEFIRFNVNIEMANYTAILRYGAINDDDADVLIYSTPEPGCLLLQVLGIIGLGALRRRD